MKTKKQEELVNSFLQELDDVIRPLYQDIVMYLSQLGYNPHKQRSYIVFKHDKHNKQMAKMGIKRNKPFTPYFSLRFSACKGYSQRFTDIVKDAVSQKNYREAGCLDNGCNYCNGKASTHVYMYVFADGVCKSHCGASTLDIPNITENDIEEIKKLIKEEHEYLLKHEAKIE